MRQTWLLGLLLSLMSLGAFAKECDSHCTDIDHHCSEKSFLYTLGSTVTTSPLIGIRSAYDAHDLIVNLSTMNEDLRILQQRYKLKERLGCEGLPCARRPLLEISGDVIGSAFWFDPFAGHSIHDINLNGARLDFLAEVGNWAFGYISLDYDKSTLPTSVSGHGQRIANSNIFLKRGFLTIGDLSKCPVYFSLGQMFVPFGRYATYIVSSPLTVSLGQTSARAALLGGYYDGGFAALYTFNGDSDVASTGVNQWGFNIGYEYQCDCYSASIGFGYIANIADATGMQNPGSVFGFRGFGFDAASEKLDHRVPGFDAHGEFTWKCFGLNLEYIAALRHFAEDDLSYNGNGAQPCALHVEADMRFGFHEYPVAIALAFDRSWETLGLNLPEDSIILAISSVPFKNTIASIEYRHDCNYSTSDTAGGSGVAAVNAMGTGQNSLVAQMGIYF